MKTGLYEQVINKTLGKEIDTDETCLSAVAPIEKAEAPQILASYLAGVLQKGFTAVGDKADDTAAQVALANRIVAAVTEATNGGSFDGLSVDERAELLLSIVKRQNGIQALDGNAAIPRPETSISQSSLFTGAIHEPSMMTELKKEIISCDRIDMLVSFIKWSGLRLIMDELRAFAQNGGSLRIITTSYMGATEVKAVEELRKLPNAEVRVSYDTKRTRLHAKTYVFYRETGFSTAYVGSSNLSNAAISSGCEWNVKVTAQDQPDVMRKIAATFESYWNSAEFEAYTGQSADRLLRALRSERMGTDGVYRLMLFDISPYPFQQEILDRLAAEREVRGLHKNLVVAATGTGKTVISAFDYKRYCRINPGKPNRLLFVAHREEILKQSLACFQAVLRDQNFGDLFVGGFRPESLDHLFISIQTFQSQALFEKTSPEFYDFIIVDEFHHAAAPTYQKLLTYYQPKILLGLTATPERMDGKDITEYFENRIAAEIRLPEAIDRKLLCPFQYFGVTDTIDLADLKWTRGGYDKSELSNIYTINRAVAERRANMIVQSVDKYVADVNEVKGLGFCVSKAHALFMAEHFNRCGIPSLCLTSDSPDEDRTTAKQRLVNGEIKFIFVVDIYNEGIDIPEVNTVLFLRPTESLTIFLQQLGRGLRLTEDKDCLTVLDFIGQANKRYRFAEKYESLLSDSARDVQTELKNGFASLPKGCYIQLERKAKEYIYDNIRSSLGLRAGLVARIASFEEDSGLPLTLSNYLGYYHMDIRSLYAKDSFSRLSVQAAVLNDFDEKDETVLSKAFYRLCTIDSRRWLSFLLRLLPNIDEQQHISETEQRMLNMLQFTIWQKSAEDCGFIDTLGGLRRLKLHNPVLYEEMQDILLYQYDCIDFIDESVDLGFDCPIDLHCTYSRDQLLVAMDFMKPATVREGVKYLPEKKADIFFVTLNKSDKEYSPTTMYNDYSINESLFHWQSQSTTSADSPTGQRYIHHRAQGSRVLLFVRESKKDACGGAAAYTFLGTADYIKHEGSRPMSITWKLERPIPAKYLKVTNQLVVG